MSARGILGRRIGACITLLLAATLCSCAGQGTVASSTSAPNGSGLPERIARGLLEFSPPADPADAAARDAAADRLSRFGTLTEAAGNTIIWGGFDPLQGYDLKAYTLTQFVPLVWAKVYLSTFMFPGPYEVRQEGKYRVLEIAAKFRAGLDPGDFAYPLWHSRKKWEAHVNIESLLLIFDHDRLVAALRKTSVNPPVTAERPWDGRWRWTDDQGQEQPRVALFSYLFSRSNPRVADLDARYRKLELAFRTENCTTCHAPDNPSRASRLLLLGFPNQALVGRHDLVKTLLANKMPPANREQGTKAGIEEHAVRESLIQLAREFESAADSTLAYEKTLAAAGDEPR